MGDMVQNGDTVEQEWINADGAMDIIEEPGDHPAHPRHPMGRRSGKS